MNKQRPDHPYLHNTTALQLAALTVLEMFSASRRSAKPAGRNSKKRGDPKHEIFIQYTTGRLFITAAPSLTYWILLKDQLMLTSPEYG